MGTAIILNDLISLQEANGPVSIQTNRVVYRGHPFHSFEEFVQEQEPDGRHLLKIHAKDGAVLCVLHSPIPDWVIGDRAVTRERYGDFLFPTGQEQITHDITYGYGDEPGRSYVKVLEFSSSDAGKFSSFHLYCVDGTGIHDTSPNNIIIVTEVTSPSGTGYIKLSRGRAIDSNEIEILDA